MTIESTVTIAPEQADMAGRLMLSLAEAQRVRTIATIGAEFAWMSMNIDDLTEVGNALLALGNDTDAIVAPAADDISPRYIQEHFEEQDRITEAYEEAPVSIEGRETNQSKETPMFKSFRADTMAKRFLTGERSTADEWEREFAPERFETATVYVTMTRPDRWTFRAHYESDEVVRYFARLEDGLREHSGDIIYLTEPTRFMVRLLDVDLGGYQVYDHSQGRYCDGVFEDKLAAEAWADTLRRAEGVPECDVPPENVLEVDGLTAARVAEFLHQLNDMNFFSLGDLVKDFMKTTDRDRRHELADALRDMASEQNVMIVREEIPF